MRIAQVLPLYSEESISWAQGGPYVLNNAFAGAERYVLNLAYALGDIGDVTLFTFGPRYRAQRLGPLKHVTIPALRRNPLNPIPKVPFALWEDFDIVHAHQLYTLVTSLLALLSKPFGKPIVATDHGGRARSPMDRLKLHRLVAHFIANSEFSRRLLPVETWTRTTVVKGGVSLNRFRYHPGSRLSSVLQVGRIMPHKGMNYLIEAAGTDTEVVIAGTVVDRAYYEYLQRLSIGKKVRFLLDPSDQIIDREYIRSTATVAASVYTDVYGRHHPNSELLGLTLLESMAVGTPVVCTAVGGMPEYVTNAETGFIVPPNDSVQLRARIRALLEDSALTQQMGMAAETHVKQFSWTNVAAQVYEQYGRVRWRKHVNEPPGRAGSSPVPLDSLEGGL